MLLLPLVNLGLAASGADAPVVVEPEARASDGGAGRWQYQYPDNLVDPWQIYAKRDKKPVSKLPERLDKAKARLKAIHRGMEDAAASEDLKRLTGQVGALARSIGLFEGKIARAIEEADQARALAELEGTYRGLEAREAMISNDLARQERIIRGQQVHLLREDDELMMILNLLV